MINDNVEIVCKLLLSEFYISLYQSSYISLDQFFDEKKKLFILQKFELNFNYLIE